MHNNQIVKKLKQLLAEKYDPENTKVFPFVNIGTFTGYILSPEIACLSSLDTDRNLVAYLYICHPRQLEDYDEPQARLAIQADNSSTLEWPHESKQSAEMKDVLTFIEEKLKELKTS